jgi:hypothetical protein
MKRLKAFFRRIRGQHKLIKAALYCYRQGKPWDVQTGVTPRQAELLEAGMILLEVKDNWTALPDTRKAPLGTQDSGLETRV